MKKIAILGSTGKIGSQALDVISHFPDEFQVIGLACGHQSAKFNQQVQEFKPKITAVAEKDGEQAVTRTAIHPEVDLVIVAVVGMAGLKPTLAAIKAKKNIALATKEVLVVAGELVMKEVKRRQVQLLPLDSEHSAIFQSLHSGGQKEIRRLIITMGKGLISQMSPKQLQKVKLKDVIHRPVWQMGEKIAVDSATCMNKAFEIIEAKWLFNVRPEQIEVVVHPEYLCHSLVEFIDGSIIAELGSPDMRRYLQYALFYPQRRRAAVASYVNLWEKRISFEKPPINKFPCLELGFKALKMGGTTAAVMHGADKSGVDAFVQEKIQFTDISKIVAQTMKKHQVIKKPNLNQLIQAEKWGQEQAKKLMEKMK